MSLHQTIKEQIKEALKAKDAVRLGVVRGLVASFTNELVSLKRKPDEELSDEEVLNVIRRAVKQRKDSIEQFTKGNRPDLADSEKAELVILETYLPAQLSEDEVMAIAKVKMAEFGVNDKTKTLNANEVSVGRPAKAGLAGMLMSALMKELKGKADGGVVKSVVDELLNQ